MIGRGRGPSGIPRGGRIESLYREGGSLRDPLQSLGQRSSRRHAYLRPRTRRSRRALRLCPPPGGAGCARTSGLDVWSNLLLTRLADLGMPGQERVDHTVAVSPPVSECALCDTGRPADDPAALEWVSEREPGGAVRWICPQCARHHLRDIE